MARQKSTQVVRVARTPDEVQRVLDLRRGSRTSRQGTGRRPQLSRSRAIAESRRAA